VCGGGGGGGGRYTGDWCGVVVYVLYVELSVKNVAFCH